jgi:hypothetical protein
MAESEGFSSDSRSVGEEEVPVEVAQARQKWGEIEQQQEALAQVPTETGVGRVVVDRGYAITCFDARQYLVEKSAGVNVNVPALAPEPPRCFCFAVPNKEVHVSAWNTIFKISKIEFDESDLTHHRILNSVHALITGVKAPPLRHGDHWKTVGFQSDDPVRDFRAAGMLGLLLPFHLFAKFEELGKKAVKTSRLPEQEFPLMVVLISFVMTALETAGTTALIKAGKDFSGCWDELAFFFAGMVENLCTEWSRDLCDMAHDFQKFQQIAERAKATPVQTVRIGKRAVALAVAPVGPGLQNDA